MSWKLEIKTKSGEEKLTFDSKDEADKALDEVMNVMKPAGTHASTVKIADQLVLKNTDIESARVYETVLPRAF